MASGSRLVRPVLFNQAVAVPIGFVLMVGAADWRSSLVIATLFSQSVGVLCWVTSAQFRPAISVLEGWRAPAAWVALFFADGVVGAEIARQVSINAFGYNLGGRTGLLSLGVGASVAVIVGLIMTSRHELRLGRDAAEAALRDRELAEARLRLAKTDADLAALQARIQPHFLFNTLNSIAALIGQDPSKAEAMTWQLASLFRYVLQANARKLVTVAEEMSIVERYLDIEKVRFGARLEVDIDWDPAVGEATIPCLLLQPIVENAVKHGIAPRPEGGAVRVRGQRDGHQVRFTVTNPFGTAGGGAGMGLESVRQRLETVYGSAAKVAFSRESDVVVTCVTLPVAVPEQPA
jgi:hypothetical protein